LVYSVMISIRIRTRRRAARIHAGMYKKEIQCENKKITARLNIAVNTFW